MHVAYLDPATLTHAASTARLAGVDHFETPVNTARFRDSELERSLGDPEWCLVYFGLIRVDIQGGVLSIRLCNDNGA